MLISLPLLTPNANFKPDFVAKGLTALSGLYPVGPGQMWHGGAHLCCPASQTHDVRAIADGTLMGYRVPTPRPTDPAELAKHDLNYAGGWTNDGFVLLKHTKESGERVPVVFYSLYMHLSKLGDNKLFAGKPGVTTASTGKIMISRKDKLGELGWINGDNDSMHFEIFTDDASFTQFFKQSQSGDGAMALWGDVYFTLPEGTPYTLDEPKPGQKVDTPHKTYQDLLVSLHYDQGARVLKAYRVTGEEIGDFTDAGAEYQLYKRAQQWFPKNTSAGYELLRFGRKIGPDELPTEAPNWQHLPLGYGLKGWVNLNQPGIRKLSDADFPDWLWRPVQEDGKLFNIADSKCDAPELIDLFDADRDGLLAPLELNYALSDEAIQQRIRSLVCLFPSEWDCPEAKIDEKLGWVKKYFENPAQLAKELAEKQKTWISGVKASTEPRLAGLEKDLLETQAGKKRFEDRQAELKKQRDEAEKASRAAALEAQKKQVALKAIRKQKKASADALTHAEEAAETAAQNAEAAKETWSRSDRALKIETECIATATQAIAQIEKQIASAKETLARAGKSLAEADQAIAKATDDLKQPPKDAADQSWERFKKHVRALQWWNGLAGTAGLTSSTVWHFHPLAFVEHYRKCHWLNEDELKLAYSEKVSGIDEGGLSKKREFYRTAINNVFYKYGVVTPIRISHYLGQGAVESGFLFSMQEKAMTPKKIEEGKAYGATIDKFSTQPEHELGHWYGSGNGEKNEWFCYDMYSSKGKRIASSYSWRNGNCGDIDAIKFRGRGFKQLTGLTNYSGYWTYRAWIDAKDFDKNWESDPQYKAKNLNAMKKRPPVITDPQRITVDAYNCIDIGGWYMTFQRSRVLKSIDNDLNTSGTTDEEKNIKTVTLAINGGDMDLDNRVKYTRHIKGEFL